MIIKVGHSMFAERDTAERDVKAFAVLTLILLTSTEVFVRFGVGFKLWVVFYAVSAVYILIDQKRMLRAVKHSWPVFLLPAFAIVSTFWSEVPERSLYASIQLLITTMIAIWIGVRFTFEKIFISLLLAAGFGILASILNDYLHFVDTTSKEFYEGMEITYTGIYNQKNVLGKVIDLLTLSLIVVGIRYRLLFMAIPLCLLLWFPLARSQSAASLLVYLVTMTLPLIWWLIRNSRSHFILYLLLVISFFASLFAILIMDLDVVNELLQSVGKDSSLTGRTSLWSLGVGIFFQQPLTGVGYQAFWQPDAFAEVKFIHAAFSGQELNGFHSAYVEVLVGLGIFGFGIFVYLLVTAMIRSVTLFRNLQSVVSLGVLFFMISTITAAFFDVILFRQHEIFYILLIAFYVMSRESMIKTESSENMYSAKH